MENDWDWQRPEFSTLEGKTLTRVVNSYDQITFHADDGSEYRQYHSQDCCESVSVDEIIGDLDDLIGTPILSASEDTNNEPKTHGNEGDYQYTDESATWTFYNLRTIKGSVTIRWYGTSNGYYSESVTFAKVK